MTGKTPPSGHPRGCSVMFREVPSDHYTIGSGKGPARQIFKAAEGFLASDVELGRSVELFSLGEDANGAKIFHGVRYYAIREV